MTTVYECMRCKKLHRSTSDAMRCCGHSYRAKTIESHETDILSSVIGGVAAGMIIESLLDSSDNDSSSSSDSSSDFSSGGGDFGGGGASGDC